MKSAVEKFRSGLNRGDFKKYKSKSWDANDIDMFKSAVHSAYLDASRTFNGVGGNTGTARENLARKIQEYFQNSSVGKVKFNEVHSELCNQFIADLGKINYVATYGQAQKVVNMTFKYLYCLTYDKPELQDYFAPCHIALDTFTLEWLKRNAGVSNTKAWSKLEKDDYTKIYSAYAEYFDLSKNTEFEKYTPFQAEFVFWPHIQLEMASEGFIFQLTEATRSDKKAIREKSLEEKLKIVHEALGNRLALQGE